MLVVPSVAHEPYAKALAPLLDGSQPIFLNPGHTGGGLHFLQELRKAGYKGPIKICETVSLTDVTRMEGQLRSASTATSRASDSARCPASTPTSCSISQGRCTRTSANSRA